MRSVCLLLAGLRRTSYRSFFRLRLEAVSFSRRLATDSMSLSLHSQMMAVRQPALRKAS
jgi:hypothetical protein